MGNKSMTKSLDAFLVALLGQLVESGSFTLMLIGILVGVIIGVGLGVFITITIAKSLK